MSTLADKDARVDCGKCGKSTRRCVMSQSRNGRLLLCLTCAWVDCEDRRGGSGARR